MLLWKAFLLEVGMQCVEAYPQTFWFVRNLGKNVAQSCLTSKNVDQSLQKNTWRTFLQVTPKKALHDLCGRNFVGKSCTKKLFVQVWGNSGKNLSRPQKFACSTPMMKNNLRPQSPPLECPAMPPFSSDPEHIILHALSLLVVVGYNDKVCLCNEHKFSAVS